MDDCRDARDGIDERGGIENIAFDRRTRRRGFAEAYERSAVDTGLHEPRQEARSYQSGGSRDEDCHVSAPLPDSRSTARSRTLMVVVIAEASSPPNAAW